MRGELQSSFRQRSEMTTRRKQQELEEQLYRRTVDAMQEVDLESQRVRALRHSCWYFMKPQLDTRRRDVRSFM